ncbi:MAG: hypothetical protein A3F72_13585 [Bacteroidetes bacterium RIFCSPLOWO2_12_FULL_35_15]|nr:MAG: hypothetical protein A3F72_13585 [Bacteroidetes bacterium RIFCSPLOWO2_12_FULL_35_15]
MVQPTVNFVYEIVKVGHLVGHDVQPEITKVNNLDINLDIVSRFRKIEMRARINTVVKLVRMDTRMDIMSMR